MFTSECILHLLTTSNKLLKGKGITLDITTVIKGLEPEESYEYVGVGGGG